MLWSLPSSPPPPFLQQWRDFDLQVVESHAVLSMWGQHARALVMDLDEFFVPAKVGGSTGVLWLVRREAQTEMQRWARTSLCPATTSRSACMHARAGHAPGRVFCAGKDGWRATNGMRRSSTLLCSPLHLALCLHPTPPTSHVPTHPPTPPTPAPLLPLQAGDRLPAMLSQGCLARLRPECLYFSRYNIFPHDGSGEPVVEPPLWRQQGPNPLRRYRWRSPQTSPKALVDGSRVLPMR